MVVPDFGQLPGEYYRAVEEEAKFIESPVLTLVEDMPSLEPVRSGCPAAAAHLAWWLTRFDPEFKAAQEKRARVVFHAEGADWVYEHLPVIEKAVEQTAAA